MRPRASNDPPPAPLLPLPYHAQKRPGPPAEETMPRLRHGSWLEEEIDASTKHQGMWQTTLRKHLAHNEENRSTSNNSHSQNPRASATNVINQSGCIKVFMEFRRMIWGRKRQATTNRLIHPVTTHNKLAQHLGRHEETKLARSNRLEEHGIPSFRGFPPPGAMMEELGEFRP